MAKAVLLYSEIYESKAFWHLGGTAAQVLIIIMSKRRMERVAGKKTKKKTWTCINPDELCFTYVEALEKFGINKVRFTRAIDALLAKGFIRQTHQGGAYKRDKSTYALSDKYLMWKPDMIIEKRAASDTVSRGYCKPARTISTIENVTHTRDRKRYSKSPVRVSKTLPKEDGQKLAKSLADAGFDGKDDGETENAP
jgi:hypothetical protein